MWCIAFIFIYYADASYKPLTYEVKACGLAVFESGGNQPIKLIRFSSNKDSNSHFIMCPPEDSPWLTHSNWQCLNQVRAALPWEQLPQGYGTPSSTAVHGIETLMTHTPVHVYTHASVLSWIPLTHKPSESRIAELTPAMSTSQTAISS